MRDEEHSLEEKDAHKGKRTPWMLREFGGKTVWDWMSLLIVPIVLSIITLAFTWQQNARQNDIEDRRARQARKIEIQRAEAERELAKERAQDEALQAYLNQMDTLLLEKDLLNAQQDSVVVTLASVVVTLARARTLTVLERLDPSRKTAVMQFLIEAELVFRGMVQLDPVIELHGANLGEIDMSGLGANLSGAILSEADLSDANLSNTIQVATILYKANLSGANLRRAVLSRASLSGATGITNGELEQRAKSLEGATMPNGQKYEDWLSREQGPRGGWVE